MVSQTRLQRRGNHLLCNVSTTALVLLLALLLPQAAHAGGARSVNGLGEPMVWPIPGPIVYNPDDGGLGVLLPAEARALLYEAFTVWESEGLFVFNEGPRETV
jgi:hypothetical protein